MKTFSDINNRIFYLLITAFLSIIIHLSPDEELLAQMRKNYEESQASKVNATMATECTNFLEDEASK